MGMENANTVNCRCRCRYKSCQMNKRKELFFERRTCNASMRMEGPRLMVLMNLKTMK